MFWILIAHLVLKVGEGEALWLEHGSSWLSTFVMGFQVKDAVFDVVDIVVKGEWELSVEMEAL